MSAAQTSRPAALGAQTIVRSPGGNQTTETRPQAKVAARTNLRAPGGANDTRPASPLAQTIVRSLGGEDSRQATLDSVPIVHAPAGLDARPTTDPTAPISPSSGGTELAGRHMMLDVQADDAASDQPADRQEVIDAQKSNAVGSDAALGPAAIVAANTKGVSLLDQALAMAADVLDDIERVRIANENRLRQLTRSVEDKDGETRGFGLDESHPDVARLAAIVDMLKKIEHDATLNLKRHMRRHPLGPWMKAQRGIGEKQGARLLAAIGDPYIRPEIIRADGTVLPEGPRTASALVAYCGYHTLPVGQSASGIHGATADGASLPAGQQLSNIQQLPAGRDQPAARHPDHQGLGAQVSGVWAAARRTRGQKANWNDKAKSRLRMIAESMLKAGNRDRYDKRRAATVDRLHAIPCAQCGTKGKPAPVGTSWKPGHQHADALRIVAKKDVLLPLWREAKRIHETTPPGQTGHALHTSVAGRGEAPERAAATNDGPPDEINHS